MMAMPEDMMFCKGRACCDFKVPFDSRGIVLHPKWCDGPFWKEFKEVGGNGGSE